MYPMNVWIAHPFVISRAQEKLIRRLQKHVYGGYAIKARSERVPYLYPLWVHTIVLGNPLEFEVARDFVTTLSGVISISRGDPVWGLTEKERVVQHDVCALAFEQYESERRGQFIEYRQTQEQTGTQDIVTYGLYAPPTPKCTSINQLRRNLQSMSQCEVESNLVITAQASCPHHDSEGFISFTQLKEIAGNTKEAFDLVSSALDRRLDHPLRHLGTLTLGNAGFRYEWRSRNQLRWASLTTTLTQKGDPRGIQEFFEFIIREL